MANLGDFDTRCGICGQRLNDGPGENNHHCDPKREAAIENGRKSHEARRENRRTFNEQLEDGFMMLELLEHK